MALLKQRNGKGHPVVLASLVLRRPGRALRLQLVNLSLCRPGRDFQFRHLRLQCAERWLGSPPRAQKCLGEGPHRIRPGGRSAAAGEHLLRHGQTRRRLAKPPLRCMEPAALDAEQGEANLARAAVAGHALLDRAAGSGQPARRGLCASRRSSRCCRSSPACRGRALRHSLKPDGAALQPVQLVQRAVLGNVRNEMERLAALAAALLLGHERL
mmetsp:Transcript_8950/g.35086  ORF Transcript_8950/g.35086 Transcript_8950/m.35086 type:complete len:213 (-) Transcript_8950:472-1110(-)